VIEEGRVAESGTHAELIASSGRYRALYETQYQRPATERRTGSSGS
jgi:ABC-type multidrug transport system fused ATPase/permease subunit